jgi:hypothetical protein
MPESKIQKILSDPRLLQFLILTIGILAAVTQYGIPIPVGAWVQDFYDAMEKIQPGDNVYVINGCVMATVADLGDLIITNLKHLRELDANVFIWSAYVDSHTLMEGFLTEVYGRSDYQNHPEYGVKFVNAGLVVGGWAVVYEAHGTDIRGYTPVDTFGVAWDTYPMMQGFNEVAQDCVLVVGYDARGMPEGFTVPYGVPNVIMGTTDGAAYLAAGYASGLTEGCVFGMRGGAEYQTATGIAGEAGTYSTAMVGACLIVLVGLAITNIVLRRSWT